MALSPRDPLVVGRVVGDLIDPFTRLISLKVTYGQRQVSNGMDLRSSHILNKPTVDIGGDDLRNFYTLVRLLSSDIFHYSFIFLFFFVKSLIQVTFKHRQTSKLESQCSFCIFLHESIKYFIISQRIKKNVISIIIFFSIASHLPTYVFLQFMAGIIVLILGKKMLGICCSSG